MSSISDRIISLRLVPVWALVTAFLVRSEVLDAYESRFGALRLQVPPEPPSTRRVTLGSGKASVEVNMSSVVLVSAEENYCQVVIVDQDEVSRSLVRATLRSIEQELPGDRFLRLHRSHLVNTREVIQVLRRGRRFFVQLRHWDESIPISRSRVDSVLARLES